MSDKVSDYYDELGRTGRDITPPPDTSRYTVDEVLRGISRDGGRYPLTILLAVYMKEKAKVGFTEGDTVKVMPAVARRDHGPGWQGYEEMFEAEPATVTEVQFSPSHDCWHVSIRYANTYRRSGFTGEIYDRGKPGIFTFRPTSLFRLDAKVQA
jgi:hypothetical protein